MGSAPPAGQGRNLIDGPTPLATLPAMFQRTVPNRDQMTLERDALRNAADPPKRHDLRELPQAEG